MTAFGIDADLSQLGMAGMGDEIDRALRPAAQAGAQVLYDAVGRNVAAIKRHTGNLASAIYQAHSADNSGPEHQTYHVSWNARKAPHGGLVEFGHTQTHKSYKGKDGKWYTNPKAPLPSPVRVPGRAFVRNAIDRAPQAEEAMEAELLARLGIAP